jgi:replicative DNA helicase
MIEPKLEDALLGCIMTDSSKLDIVKPWVTDDEFFYTNLNRRIWKTMLKLDERGHDIDVNTVSNSIERTSSDNGLTYTIIGYLELVVSVSKVEDYAKLLHSSYLRRKLKNQVQHIEQFTKDDSIETQVLLEDAHTTIGNLIKLQPSRSFNLGDLLENTSKSIFEQSNLINTGISILDSVISGMTRGEISIIAGRPGNAKTTVAANIARNLINDGQKVVMFNREMPNVEMMKKFMAMESRDLPYRNLRHNVDIDSERIEEVSNIIRDKYEDKLFMFDDVRDLDGSFREIKAINPDVVIDDHIGLIEYPVNDNRDLRHKIGDTTRKYKWLAKSEEMCVLLVSQMNRNMEHRNDRVPRLSDLAESGNLEQDAEMVMFSHYPWVNKYGDDGNSECYLELIVAKNRYGNTNICKIGYDGNRCTVYETEEEAMKSIRSRGEEIRKMELFD